MRHATPRGRLAIRSQKFLLLQILEVFHHVYLGYKKPKISTIVDYRQTNKTNNGYKKPKISTIVDHSKIKTNIEGYKKPKISTIVDDCIIEVDDEAIRSQKFLLLQIVYFHFQSTFQAIRSQKFLLLQIYQCLF